MKISHELQSLVYAFSSAMLVVSVLSFDEPLSVFILIGIGMMFGGPRFVPGIPGKAIYVIGLGIALIAAFLALVIVIALIAVFSQALFIMPLPGVLPWAP